MPNCEEQGRVAIGDEESGQSGLRTEGIYRTKLFPGAKGRELVKRTRKGLGK